MFTISIVTVNVPPSIDDAAFDAWIQCRYIHEREEAVTYEWRVNFELPKKHNNDSRRRWENSKWDSKLLAVIFSRKIFIFIVPVLFHSNNSYRFNEKKMRKFKNLICGCFHPSRYRILLKFCKFLLLTMKNVTLFYILFLNLKKT